MMPPEQSGLTILRDVRVLRVRLEDVRNGRLSAHDGRTR